MIPLPGDDDGPGDIIVWQNCLDKDWSQPNTSSCWVYGQCSCLYGINVRCMCQCMGSNPWESFVRACLQCLLEHGRGNVTWKMAHAMCWAQADIHFPGLRPTQGLVGCSIECASYQATNCKGSCNPPAWGPPIAPDPGDSPIVPIIAGKMGASKSIK